MELHPILEKDICPSAGLWYVLSAMGDCPSMRVGLSATHLPGPPGTNGKVYVIGGANPNGPFAETYILDLDTFSWDICDAPGLRSRYEHSAFVPDSKPTCIYIFGGADKGGNHNDIQVFDTVSKSWSTVTCGGTGAPPTPRTYFCAACVGDKFVVYSGGQSGSDPVGDRQVHCFNVQSHSWSILNIHGDSPKPRHGHLVQPVGNKIVIHGGMSGTTFYGDLHVLDVDKGSWRSVNQKRVYPCARAAHCGVACGSDLYIFGGMNKDGALDDLHKLDTVAWKWTKIEIDSPPPASRLDFGMCSIKLWVPTSTTPSTQDTAAAMATSKQAKEVIDQQLNARMGSAGSVSSVGSMGSLGSAGSQRSGISVGSLPLGVEHSPEHLSPTALQPKTASEQPNESEASGAVAMATLSDYKMVEMCLVVGGMDSEGEIFEDCLVFPLREVSTNESQTEEDSSKKEIPDS